MGKNTEKLGDEATRLDRDYTGDAVNARTDTLKQELEQQTDRLQEKYEETGKPEADGEPG